MEKDLPRAAGMAPTIGGEFWTRTEEHVTLARTVCAKYCCGVQDVQLRAWCEVLKATPPHRRVLIIQTNGFDVSCIGYHLHRYLEKELASHCHLPLSIPEEEVLVIR